MSATHDVIIAGAGPVGLFLACELRLAGVSVLILERDSDTSSDWKIAPLGIRGLNVPCVEAFYRRGLLEELLAEGQTPKGFLSKQAKPGVRPAGHFAGITLDAAKIDLKRWKYKVEGPSMKCAPTTLARMNEVLTERAESLGVEILTGCGVSSAEGDERGVTVGAGSGRSFRCKWLVGCDGGRSTVRKAAGIDFIGTDAKFTGYAIHCDFDHPERVAVGFHPTKNGMYIHGGLNALYLMDFDGGAFDRSSDITLQYVQELFERISGVTDLKLSKIHLASAFTDRCKQATTYRKGRILLAGDAAHIHGPVGSQGMNLGLGDAMNLGWKLATTIRREAEAHGEAPSLSLLDTYEKERRPIGEWVLAHTIAQVTILQPDSYGQASQKLMREIIDTVDGTNLLIGRHWGLDQRYLPDEIDAQVHPLVGCSAPDFEFHDGMRLGPRLAHGQWLLLNLGSDKTFGSLGGDRKERNFHRVSLVPKDARGLASILVRPDGIVAWAADEGMDAQPGQLAAMVDS